MRMRSVWSPHLALRRRVRAHRHATRLDNDLMRVCRLEPRIKADRDCETQAIVREIIELTGDAVDAGQSEIQDVNAPTMLRHVHKSWVAKSITRSSSTAQDRRIGAPLFTLAGHSIADAPNLVDAYTVDPIDQTLLSNNTGSRESVS